MVNPYHSPEATITCSNKRIELAPGSLPIPDGNKHRLIEARISDSGLEAGFVLTIRSVAGWSFLNRQPVGEKFDYASLAADRPFIRTNPE